MGHHPKKDSGPKLSGKERLLQKRKEEKKFRTEKKARLIVRNLPFKADEEKLKEHYAKYGDVVEVKLLRRPDGKLVGCGFVQYKEVNQAAKARFHTNGQPFIGRTIECDWALAKNKYLEKRGGNANNENDQQQQIKNEVVEIKDEPIEDDSGFIKSENENELDDTKEDIEEVDNEEKKSDDEMGSENDDEDEDKEDIEEVKEEKPVKEKYHSNDVTEGKTIFVKNIPFTATNDDLKQCMRQYGPVYYALICMDKFTEHSKGTGFVKFVNVEDAEKALQAGTELTLLGNVLDCVKALNRNEVNNKKADKEEQRDSRNLYLVKEGVVLAGTKAAEGVSASDMAKRLQIEQYKTQMLRNLNMFVSKNRLVVHNLPASWDDSKFRQLMQKHGGDRCLIKEARIMRNMKKMDSNGVGASKEFGFVTFGTHEQALTALRSLNNNPNIFSEGKRPIVAFSIESKSMVKAKEKRLQNSRLKNPTNKQYDPNLHQTHKKEENNEKQTKFGGGKKRKQGNSNEDQSPAKKQKRMNDKFGKNNANNDNEKVESFVGVEAKKGVNKMRSRYKLKTQAEIHHQSMKELKKKQKKAKKPMHKKREKFIRQPGQKINKKIESDSFSKLVNSYKSKLISAPAATKQKWYEAT